jgi:flagellar FliL protein
MAKPAKPAAAEADAPAKPKNKKLILIIVAVLVLAAAGGGAWFFLKGSSKPEAPKAVASEPPTFLTLDPFTVNLQQDEGNQYLNIGITLKVSSVELADKVRLNLPDVRSRLLFLLSSKHAAELVPLEGKQKLAHEISAEINNIIGVTTAPQKIAEHEVNPAPNTESVSGTASGVASSASSAVEAHPPATASVEPSGGEAKAGVLDVLFTAFIIQ